MILISILLLAALVFIATSIIFSIIWSRWIFKIENYNKEEVEAFKKDGDISIVWLFVTIVLFGVGPLIIIGSVFYIMFDALLGIFRNLSFRPPDYGAASDAVYELKMKTLATKESGGRLGLLKSFRFFCRGESRAIVEQTIDDVQRDIFQMRVEFRCEAFISCVVLWQSIRTVTSIVWSGMVKAIISTLLLGHLLKH